MIAALTPRRVEIGLWLLLYAGLAIGIGLETDWGQVWQWPLADSPAVAESPTPLGLTEPYRLPPADAFIEIPLRPVFVVTRQPPPPPLPEVPIQVMKKDQFTLTGVTIVPDGKFAFLIEKAGGKSRSVTEGQEINGIKVKEILADRVVLSQYGDSEVLTLRASKGPASTVNAQPAQAAPAGAAPRPDRKRGDHPPTDNGGGVNLAPTE